MAKKTTDVESKTVTFDFGDGRVETFQLDNVSETMLIQLALHGASQKIGDSYASAKSATAETDVDPNDWSQAQANGVIGQLADDDWSVRQPGSASVTDLATALAEAAPCTVEEAIERLADSDKDDKAALRKHPDVAAVLARIKRERAEAKEKTAAAKAGTGESLADFMSA